MYIKRKISYLLLTAVGIFFISERFELQANLDGTTGTAIYLGSNYTFTDHEVAKGYVSFAGGFTLPNAGTAYVGTNQLVGGTINLNNGTLVLRDHLHLAPQATIIGTGTIDGNGNKRILFESDHTFTSSINFILPNRANIITFNAQGNIIAFSAPNNPAVAFYCAQDADPFATVINFENGTLVGFAGGKTSFPLNHGTQTIFSFLNMTLIALSNGFTLEGPRTVFAGRSRVIGNNAIFEMKAKSVIIPANSDLSISSGIKFIYNVPDPFGIKLGVRNSTLIFDNCNISRDSGALGTSWTFTNGSMIINGLVTLDIEPGQQLMTLGDGISATADLDFIINPGSTFKINRGGIIYNNIF